MKDAKKMSKTEEKKMLLIGVLVVSIYATVVLVSVLNLANFFERDPS